MQVMDTYEKPVFSENGNRNFRSESFFYHFDDFLVSFFLTKGVEKVRVEWEASKLTVEGKVDPAKLRQRLQEKTKKKVELISPQPNKNNNPNNNTDSSKCQEKKADEKKPKEV